MPSPKVRIATDDLKRYVGARLSADVRRLTGYRDRVTSASAKNLPPAVADIFHANKSGRSMSVQTLGDFISEDANAAIDDVVGIGRAAVSRAHADLLPDHLLDLFDDLHEERVGSECEELALHEPFPQGRVETTYFDRFVGAQERVLVDRLIDQAKVRPRLVDLLEAVEAAGGTLVFGDVTVHAASHIMVADQKYSLYAHERETKLIARCGDEVIAIGWNSGEDHSDKLATVKAERFDTTRLLGDPIAGVTHHRAGSTFEEVMRQNLPAACPPRSDAQATYDRVPQSDLTTLAAVVELLDHNDGAAGAHAKDFDVAQRAAGAAFTKNVGRFVSESNLIEMLRDVERVARDVGASIDVCDNEIEVRIAKRWTRPSTYDGDKLKANTMVAGRRDLLIIENSFGSLGYAIPLSSLARGRLELHVALGDTMWATFDITRTGIVHQAGDRHALVAVMDDLPTILQNLEDLA